MKIIFAGTPYFSSAVLKTLLKIGHEVVCVLTQPDRKRGRGKKIQSSEVKSVAKENNLKILQPEHLKSESVLKELKKLKPDVLLVVSYGLIIPEKLLNIARNGSINIHASLLPKWRGAAPIERSILNGDKETGITYIQMEPSLDSGSILKKISCSIEKNETSGSLQKKLLDISLGSLEQLLNDYVENKIIPENQSEDLVSYAKKITIEEARINWKNPSNIIIRAINAFNPKPGAYSFIANERIKILKAKKGPKVNLLPGYFTKTKDTLTVACQAGESIEIEELQLPGKKLSEIKNILNSNVKIFKEKSFHYKDNK